eukprot:480723-Amphidinium_carterae.1
MGDVDVAANECPVLVAKERLSGIIWSHPLRSKDDGYALASLLRDVRNLGYKRLVLKCDREP